LIKSVEVLDSVAGRKAPGPSTLKLVSYTEKGRVSEVEWIAFATTSPSCCVDSFYVAYSHRKVKIKSCCVNLQFTYHVCSSQSLLLKQSNFRSFAM
jgi:hypothetical protein